LDNERRLRRRRRAVVCMLQGLKLKRRTVQRTDGGWESSTLNQYVLHGDEQTFSQKFRVSKTTFAHIVHTLDAAGYVKDNTCQNTTLRMTAAFKVGVCMYYLAQGTGGAHVMGDVASIGEATVRLYLKQFCRGVLDVLRCMYMPARPPSAANLERIRAEFSKRRGLRNVAMAVDGTHIPFRGGPDYRNYKGWTSILAVAFVNSFYLFVDADVGAAGRAGDNGVLAQSWLLERIQENSTAWLGEHGVIAADGGASDGGKLLLNPIPNARSPEDCWYNFCHSSTRFFVEETFGRWKNRFRFLLRESHLSHKMTTQLIYVSMILHNMCTVRKDDSVTDFDGGTDAEWTAFFEKFAREACPACIRRKAAFCPHVEKHVKKRLVHAKGSCEMRNSIRDQLWADLADDEVMSEMYARAERARNRNAHVA